MVADLKSANVVLVGTDNLAQTIGLVLAQCVSDLKLEVLTVVDSTKVKAEPSILPLEKNTDNPAKAKAVVDALRKVNERIREYDPAVPDAEFFYINEQNICDASDSIKVPDMIVDTKHAQKSKAATAKFAKEHNIPAIYAVAGHEGRFSFESFDVSRFEGQKQNPVVSGVIAGTLAEQIANQIYGRRVVRDFSYALPFSAEKMSALFGKTVALVGVGALGNVTGPELALSGINLKFADDDSVEKKNYTKQYMYCFGDCDGKKKSAAFEASLKNMLAASGLKNSVLGMAESVESCQKLESIVEKADALALTVDNDFTRCIASDFSIGKIPATETAIDQVGGRVAHYHPDKTICLYHMMGYIKGTRQETSQPCGNVVIPARIVGSLAAAEILAALAGEPLCGAYLQYASGDITAIGVANHCEHAANVNYNLIKSGGKNIPASVNVRGFKFGDPMGTCEYQKRPHTLLH